MARYPKELSVKPSKVKFPDGTEKKLADLTEEEMICFKESLERNNGRTVKAIMERDPERNIPIWSQYFETSYIERKGKK